MPVIYTKDPVGQAIEDHHWGSLGICTGFSTANQIGLQEYQRKQDAERRRREAEVSCTIRPEPTGLYSSSPSRAKKKAAKMKGDDKLTLGEWVLLVFVYGVLLAAITGN